MGSAGSGGLPAHARPGVYSGYRTHGGAGASLVAQAFKGPEESLTSHEERLLAEPNAGAGGAAA